MEEERRWNVGLLELERPEHRVRDRGDGLRNMRRRWRSMMANRSGGTRGTRTSLGWLPANVACRTFAYILLSLPAGASAQPALDSFLAAYERTSSIRVGYRKASSFADGTDVAVIERVRSIPGVSVTIHPVTKAEMFDLQHSTLECDGGDRVRIETRNLLYGGDPVRGVAVMLWDHSFIANGRAMGMERIDVRPILPNRDHSVVPDLSLGYARERAELSFVMTARWIRQAISTAPDIVVETDGGRSLIRSDQLGLTLSVNSESGELAELVANAADGSVSGWVWDGYIPGSVFPARHPKVERRWYVEAATGAPPQCREGDVVFYDVVEPIAAPAAARFHWTSLAPKALNSSTTEVLNADGSVDSAATAAYRAEVTAFIPVPPAITPEGALIPIATARWNRSLLIAGLVALMLCLGFFLRRKLA